MPSVPVQVGTYSLTQFEASDKSGHHDGNEELLLMSPAKVSQSRSPPVLLLSGESLRRPWPPHIRNLHVAQQRKHPKQGRGPHKLDLWDWTPSLAGDGTVAEGDFDRLCAG